MLLVVVAAIELARIRLAAGQLGPVLHDCAEHLFNLGANVALEVDHDRVVGLVVQVDAFIDRRADEHAARRECFEGLVGGTEVTPVDVLFRVERLVDDVGDLVERLQLGLLLPAEEHDVRAAARELLDHRLVLAAAGQDQREVVGELLHRLKQLAQVSELVEEPKERDHHLALQLVELRGRQGALVAQLHLPRLVVLGVELVGLPQPRHLHLARRDPPRGDALGGVAVEREDHVGLRVEERFDRVEHPAHETRLQALAAMAAAGVVVDFLAEDAVLEPAPNAVPHDAGHHVGVARHHDIEALRRVDRVQLAHDVAEVAEQLLHAPGTAFVGVAAERIALGLGPPGRPDDVRAVPEDQLDVVRADQRFVQPLLGPVAQGTVRRDDDQRAVMPGFKRLRCGGGHRARVKDAARSRWSGRRSPRPSGSPPR